MKTQMTVLDDAGVLVALEGELDAYTGPEVREALAAALADGARWLFVDLSRVDYMDSVGLGILVGMAKRAGEVEGGLAAVGPRDNVRRVFDVSGTRELLNVVDSLEAAKCRLCPADKTGGEETSS